MFKARSDQWLYGVGKREYFWEVAITRGRVRYMKTFYFRELGGEDHALRHALAWRDKLVKAHEPVQRQVRAARLRVNNKTGVPGVTCQLGPDGRPKLWLAKTYIGPGRVLRRAFSVSRWGAEAKDLAIAARLEQLAHMTGLAKVHPVEEKVRLEHDSLPPPKLPPAPVSRSEMVRQNNKSGVAGVQRRPSQGNGGYWTAQTSVGNRSISKSFSIKKLGEAQAKALAIEERRRQLQGSAPR